MAVHDLGYRKWSGRLAPAAMRWTVIARTGVRRAWQSRWLRRLLVFAWLPAFWFGIGFLVWEQSLIYPELRQALTPFLIGMPRTGPLAGFLEGFDPNNPVQSRHEVWAWLLQSFFRYPQGVIMVLVVGLIAPSLISQDMRSRAFLLYFSRPLTRTQYVLGKTTTVWIYLALIATLPALCLYVLGVLLSPTLEVVQVTWDLPLRVLAASAVLMIPTASLALCISSLTQESRYAGFAWFAIWALGWFTFGVMRSVETMGSGAAGSAANSTTAWWSHVSLYHTLGNVQTWIFGFVEFREVRSSAIVLLAVTIVSTALLFWRVTAPMRA